MKPRIIALLGALLIAAYVFFNLWTGRVQRMDVTGRVIVFRTFDRRWEPYFFLPAESCETWVRARKGEEFRCFFLKGGLPLKALD